MNKQSPRRTVGYIHDTFTKDSFLRQAVREQQIPFQIRKNVLNGDTVKAMEAAEKGTDLYGPFDNTEDLMEALNA